MLELKTPKERAGFAHRMAESFELVRYQGTTYAPAHYETGDSSYVPAPQETMWVPMRREEIRRLAASQFDMLFASDGELAGFDFMVAQNCAQVDEIATSLLVRTHEGLRQLDDQGRLVEVTGKFVPNTLTPMLNEDPEAKAGVLAVIQEWVGGEEEAESLLSHLATSLAPGYSAVKYVLLLGEGRNGKSVLLKMIHRLFGDHNVSNVTRQQIAESNPVVLDLNGKLLNLVYDGRAEYLKDSGTEKSLIAGEQVPIRRLYESTPTPVQTNALFVEALNKEPKSNDKSTALQKRLVRFLFSNVYALDIRFEREMLSEEKLGAFLALLVDRYVKEDEVAERLAPTSAAVELQLEHMYINSVALQFLKHVEETDPLGLETYMGEELAKMVQAFQSWRILENDLSGWAEPDVAAQLQPLITTDRKTKRIDGKPRKVRVVTGLKIEAQHFIDSLKGDADEDLTEAVVED
jgi:phage/plasmid-associated DNA primase